jgi:uncharacterized coiled-coil DUF342 family protein
MVDFKGMIKHMEKNITALEKELYNFEIVAMSRYNTDKKILAQMRADVVKAESHFAKLQKGEDLTAEELAEIPQSFR